MNCQYCGSEEVEYHGVDDGGGDYGSSVCDQWECFHCGNMFEADCIEVNDDEEPDSSGGWDGGDSPDDDDDSAAADDDPDFDRFLIDNGLIHDPDGDVIDL